MEESPDRTAAGELASQVRGLVLVRLVVLTVLGLLLAGADRAGALLGVSAGPLVGLVVGAMVLTLLWRAGLRFGMSPGTLAGSQVGVDLVVGTLLVGGTGGIHSPFILLYFLTIFTAGMVLRRGGAIAAAIGATLGIASLAFFVGDDGVRLSNARLVTEIAVHAGGFLLLALLSATLSERSRRQRAALVSKDEELQRVLLSTDRIMESMPIGLMTASEDGTIVRANRAARTILGIAAATEPIGRGIDEFLGGLDGSLVDALESARLTRKWAIRDEIVVRREGADRPVGVAVTPLVHGETELEGVIVTFTDLSQVRRMEREMLRSEQLASLGELAAGVAHEIRNPLASISGAIQVLRAEVPEGGDEAELMDLVVRESDRLNRTIDGMLDYTRDHSRSRAVHDVANVAREVGRLLSHDQKLSLGKTILLEFPASQDFRAEIEEAGIRQVFFNLARNALEAMGVGGILRITGESPGDGRIYVVFRDTGQGIPPHELENIFKPFHTSKRGGTGLGLSIASRIVEGNEGAIRVKSTPGVGTAFTVELPATDPDEGSSGGGPAPKEEGTPSGPPEHPAPHPSVEATR